MTKKLLIILLVVVVAVGATLGFFWWQTKRAELPKTPEETLKEIIEKNVRQEFLPSTYKIVDKPDYLELMFEEGINYFFTEWYTKEAHFVTAVAFSTTSPQELLGYEVTIAVKNPELTGKQLGEKFLKSFFLQEWSHVGPLPFYEKEGEIEMSCSVSVVNDKKVYGNIFTYKFFEPQTMPHFPNESIKEMELIGYGVCMPNSPYYDEVENKIAQYESFLRLAEEAYAEEKRRKEELTKGINDKRDKAIVSAIAQARVVMTYTYAKNANYDDVNCDYKEMKSLCAEVVSKGGEINIVHDSANNSQKVCMYSRLNSQPNYWYCADSRVNAGFAHINPGSNNYCVQGGNIVCPFE